MNGGQADIFGNSSGGNRPTLRSRRPRRRAWIVVGGLATVLTVSGVALRPVLAAPSSSGLVAHWNFDAGSGTVLADSSGNGHDGSLLRGPTWVAGKSGTALSFSGSRRPYIGSAVAHWCPRIWTRPTCRPWRCMAVTGLPW